MARFGSPFSVLAQDRLLTNEELVRYIRFMIAAEFRATQPYAQPADPADKRLAMEAWGDTENEVRMQAGGFPRWLLLLIADEETIIKAHGKKTK
jgi:hypothetical protein